MKKFLVIAVALVTFGFSALHAGGSCCGGEGGKKDKGSEKSS